MRVRAQLAIAAIGVPFIGALLLAGCSSARLQAQSSAQTAADAGAEVEPYSRRERSGSRETKSRAVRGNGALSLIVMLIAIAVSLIGCSSVRLQAQSSVHTAAEAGAEEVVTVREGKLVRQLRVGGTTVAVHAYTMRIPQIPGQSSQFTVVGIVDNGTVVKVGDLLVQFDDTLEKQNALDAKAKYDDFSHQVEDTVAQNRANAESRASDLQQAEADLGKAQLELKKAPILSPIDAQTDQLNVDDATAHIASLKREDAFKDAADAAALKILELQRDQQKVEWQRAQSSVEKLALRAPLGGMVGLIPVWRANNQAPAQPGDQLNSGNAVLRIFDARDMAVNAAIDEADGASLRPGLKGILHLDAYPDARLAVHFESASPVATSSWGSPVHDFSARFHVDQADSRLFPDLSAAVDLQVEDDVPHALVPRSAVHFVHNEPYVTKRVGGKSIEQRVELGNFNEQQVSIIAGVVAGDRVVVGSSSVAEEGSPK